MNHTAIDAIRPRKYISTSKNTFTCRYTPQAGQMLHHITDDALLAGHLAAQNRHAEIVSRTRPRPP